jgi:hypothetical protein
LLVDAMEIIEAALLVSQLHVADVSRRAEQRQDGDSPSMHPDLSVSHFAEEEYPPPTRSARSRPVLDPTRPHPAQVIVVDPRAIGHQQLDGGVVDIEANLDVSRIDASQEQVKHDEAA